jgi:hypothetical protein
MSTDLDFFFKHLAESQGARADAEASNKAIANAIRRSLFQAQLNFVKDKNRNKSAICPRRAGKSFCCMAYAFDTCLRRMGAKVVIVTLTLGSAKNIYWWEMQEFARQYGVPIKGFFANDLRVELENGSQIRLIGAESRAQIDKLRGGQYDLVIVDEAKSYPPSILHELLWEVIEPALGDRRGTLAMIGTPGNILTGPFFEATFPGAKNEKGRLIAKTYGDPEAYWKNNPKDTTFQWSRHTWTRKDNTAMPHLWEEAEAIKARNHWDDDHPTWQREYLGRWVASETAFVYSFPRMLATAPEKVTWQPDYENGNKCGLDPEVDWYYVLGLDLGFEDDFAATVGAYNPHDGCLYQVWEYKDNHQDLDQVAEHITRAMDAIDGKFTAVVADAVGLGKLLVETLNRRHGWNIQPAEKREKFDHIELLNTDFNAGRVKLLPKGDLATELQGLQWDVGKASKEFLARTGKLKEHPGCPNHLADAWLYLWRYSYHYWAEERPVVHEQGTREWQSAQEKAAMEMLTRQRSEQLDKSFWDELEDMSIDPLEDFYGN